MTKTGSSRANFRAQEQNPVWPSSVIRWQDSVRRFGRFKILGRLIVFYETGFLTSPAPVEPSTVTLQTLAVDRC